MRKARADSLVARRGGNEATVAGPCHGAVAPGLLRIDASASSNRQRFGLGGSGESCDDRLGGTQPAFRGGHSRPWAVMDALRELRTERALRAVATTQRWVKQSAPAATKGRMPVGLAS